MSARQPHLLVRLCLASMLVLPTGAGRGDEPPASPSPGPGAPVFGAEASVVLLDVVVRDKRGHAVKDLTAADFEVSEDGARQTVSSFRIVDAPGIPAGEAPAPSPAPSAAEPAPPAAADHRSRPSVIVFVFDRLQPEARKLAHKAALVYAERGHVDGDVVAVFSIDLALRVLQGFTTDLDAVRVAFNQAATQANTQFASTRDEARLKASTVARSEQALDALGASGGATDASTATVAAGLAIQVAFASIEQGLARTYDALERDQQGFASTNGLLAVVSSLRAIPGRKTVVFFSEGLALTANVQGQFRSVIAAANRSNVAVYTVDAGGLRTHSGTEEAREEVKQQAQRRARQEATGEINLRDGALTQGLERNEDNLRLNPHAGLGQLADETGGFLIRDSNDAASEFRRIQEDMRFHYLLTYSPSDPRFDGHFRTIAVKVRRPGVEVHARKGYLAVQPDTAVPVRSYEAPALAELERSPRPEAFPLEAAALSFPEPSRPGRVSIFVSLPGDAVRYAAGETDRERRADFAIVARLRDESRREVDRASQQYRLSVAADKLAAAQKGAILFFKELDLPPGRFTLEAVAYDSLGQQASVRTGRVEVPSAPPGELSLSSLVVLQRAETLPPKEQGLDNPLVYGGALLYPNMGAPLSRSRLPALGFFYTIYGVKPAEAPRASVELLQGGRRLVQAPASLSAPDGRGRIQQAGALPLKDLAPGAYTLRLTVSEGARSASRETAFTVVD